ncbi:hypothetical protein [Nocardioides terrae]|uniref:hypothetical protein n=1 Tax=Nocardioides terrae TaxID=574651 RepID=UPI000B836B34|nr:hypothetical protein [Nocardioides terrae]
MAAGFLAIAGQRIGVNLGDTSIPLSTIVLAGFYLRLLVSGGGLSLVGTGLWLALGATCGLSALANPAAHVTSLMLMLLTYVPWLLLPAREQRLVGVGRAFLVGTITAIKCGAVLAILQAAVQWAGSPSLWDPVGRFVPLSMQVHGFNSVYSLEYVDVTYGLHYKPNGILFLEPSFVSLYCGFGIVCLVHGLFFGRRSPRYRDAVWALTFAVAITVSMSTSGLPVLAFGLIPALRRLPMRPATTLATACLALGAWRMGALDGLIAKATEGFGPTSSTGLRLALPYHLLLPFADRNPLIGLGPGVASDLLDQLAVTGLQASTFAKAMVEYGLAGVSVFVVATAYAIYRSRPPAMLTLALLAAWLVPAEALLNAPIVALLFFVATHWRAEGDGVVLAHPGPAVGSSSDLRDVDVRPTRATSPVRASLRGAGASDAA